MRPPGGKLSEREVIRPTRLIKYPHPSIHTDKVRRIRKLAEEDIEAQPTLLLPATPRPQMWETTSQSDPDAGIPPEMLDIGSMNTMRLMAISGMMRAVRPAAQTGEGSAVAAIAIQPTIPHRPLQAGPLIISNNHQRTVWAPSSTTVAA